MSRPRKSRSKAWLYMAGAIGVACLIGVGAVAGAYYEATKKKVIAVYCAMELPGILN